MRAVSSPPDSPPASAAAISLATDSASSGSLAVTQTRLRRAKTGGLQAIYRARMAHSACHVAACTSLDP